MFERDRLVRVAGGIAQRGGLDLSRLAWASGGNAAVPRRRKASKKVGAHHARPDRKRIKSFCGAKPPRKLRWTDAGRCRLVVGYGDFTQDAGWRGR